MSVVFITVNVFAFPLPSPFKASNYIPTKYLFKVADLLHVLRTRNILNLTLSLHSDNIA